MVANSGASLGHTAVLAGDLGIEPRSSDLEADVLPLHQSPVARSEGFEPSTIRVEAGCSDPLSYERLARQVGFEPTTSGSEARRTDPLCYWRRDSQSRRAITPRVSCSGVAPLPSAYAGAVQTFRSGPLSGFSYLRLSAAEALCVFFIDACADVVRGWWSGRLDSNQRHRDPKSRTLTAELRPGSSVVVRKWTS